MVIHRSYRTPLKMSHSYVVYSCLLFISQVHKGHQRTSCNQSIAWQASDGCCGGKNVASLVTQDDLKYFTDEMKRRNLASVWTGLTRKPLPTWTWVDNSTDFPSSMNAGADTARCALLDMKKKQMERELCGARGKGHICEKRGCSSCSELAASTCFQIDNKCYIYFCDEVNFDKARTNCLKAGYDLARLPSNFSQMLIGQQYCKQFWIGLRREDWMPVGEFTGSRHVSLWLPPEPSEDGKCSVMNWDRISFTWRVVPCRERHHVICGKHTGGKLTSRGTTGSSLTSAVSFTSHTTTQQTQDGINILGIVVGLGGSLLLLLIAITIAWFIWRRKRKYRHRRRTGQQEGEPSIPLLNKKFSTKQLRQKIAEKLLRLHHRIELWSFQEDFVDMELDEIYTDMTWSTSMGTYDWDDDMQHHYLHIFNKNKDGLRPDRILVLGEAGVGKTTFVKKMLVDWSRGVESSKQISRKRKGLEQMFTCVVPVFLRDISKDEPFQFIIKRQLKIDDPTCERLIEEMTYNPKRILLIFEGYDEFQEDYCADILDIIEGKNFQDINILITCRTPYMFYLPGEKGRADIKVHIRGFSDKSIKEYIDRYFKKKKQNFTRNINFESGTAEKREPSSLGETDKEDTPTKAVPVNENSTTGNGLYRKIQSKDELEEMSRVPAVLLLMCILWNDRGDLANTLTGFYKDFIKYMCQRYARKYITDKKILHTEIFSYFRKELIKLGEIAFDGLKEENIRLSFSREVINKIMGEDKVTMKLGFLREVERTFESTDFSFYHKTIQEFFTAYYIVECDENKRLQLLMSFCSSKHRAQESKQILRFVVGLGGYGVKYHVEEAMSGWTENAIRDKITFQLTYLDENRDVEFELPPVVEIEMSSSHKASTYTRFFKMPAGDVEELHMIVVDLTVMCYLREMTAPNLKVLTVSLSTELPTLYPQKELRENCQMEEMLTNFPLQQLAFKDFKKDNSRHIVSLCKRLDCVETLKSLDLSSCKLLSDSVQELENTLPRLMERQGLRLGDI